MMNQANKQLVTGKSLFGNDALVGDSGPSKTTAGGVDSLFDTDDEDT